jgi:large subunit ribosomal protein L21
VFAIIKDSGRQYKVNQGDKILVDLKGLSEGSEILFDKVLMVDEKVGTPLVEGAKVLGVVKGEVKGEKIHVHKFKRRKKYRRHIGHRQAFTQVEITSIEA